MLNNITRETRVLKNESWPISDLIKQINSKKIKKPKFQRQKKWLEHPNPNNEYVPNDKNYIKFLYKTKNSVDPITFGDNSKLNSLENIDGNNRINAINNFLNNPFKLFPEFLEDLNKLIDNLQSLNNEDKKILKNIFSSIDYKNIFNFNRFSNNKHFDDKDETKIRDKLSNTDADEIMNEIDKIKNKLSIDDDDDNGTFLNIRINVNISIGYTIEELSQIFIDINKYKNHLTKNEKLAADLYSVNNFEIKDKILENNLKEIILNYYEEKNIDECLEGYKYIKEDSFNAFDFIVSFQNYINTKTAYYKKYKKDKKNLEEIDTFYMIEKYHTKKDLSLFCKIFKFLYSGLEPDKFTNHNINEFIEDIQYSVCILNKIRIKILSNNSFNSFTKVALKKFSSLSLNALYIFIVNIIAYKKINETENNIILDLEKKILFHLMITDIKGNKDIEFSNFKSDNKKYDMLLFETGTSEIETRISKIYKNPNGHIITKDIFKNLLKKIIESLRNDIINTQKIKNNSNVNAKDKRRVLTFTEQILYYYYYKNKVPQEYINNIFSNEHIIPFSLKYENKLDIDRTGNMIPIIDKLNLSRGNKHINFYKTKEQEEKIDYVKFIETIPTNDTYDEIVKDKKIINNEEYNNMCIKNESKLIDNFINIIF